ncbi:hypothetical protein V6N11_034749 [Hibiscus sabdariffa]|uniref:Retrovirus-related Pol polyprotein from transposon TNT 1-94-like beta-barrel domain-containing protein n=1 Tax=Hibiscus sabdariffa TaxID=183260 RepID=A0ABR2NRW3_9ROSI
MFDHFFVIVNGLKGLGEVIPEDKLVRKLLYSLPESRDNKRTAIIEAKDLKTLKLDARMGSLLTLEIMKQGREEEKKIEEKRRSWRRRRSKCPQLKKKSFGKKKKLKAQINTWSDEESSDEEEQEVANLCLMTLEEDSKGEHCYKANASCANSWYLDSGCSRHMTGDKSRFLELKPKSGGVVTFGDNSKGHIEGIGSIAYRVFNKRTLVVEEHVVFDDNLLPRKDSCDDDDVGILETNGGEQSSKVDEMPTKEEAQDPPLEALKDMSLEKREVSYPRELNYVKGGEILGDPSKGETTRSSLRNTYFAKLMQGEFEMSMMGELSFFLGLQIKQRKDETFINQAKYIKENLKKLVLENVKPQATPMSSSNELDKDEGGKFQANPKESHLKAVKRIFRYLKDTPSLGLWYPRDSTFDLHAYSNADYGGCKIDRKSTSDTCQVLGNMLISWFLKKQNSVALSTTEVEYILASS